MDWRYSLICLLKLAPITTWEKVVAPHIPHHRSLLYWRCADQCIVCSSIACLDAMLVLSAVSSQSETWCCQWKQHSPPSQPGRRPAIAAHIWSATHPVCQQQPHPAVWCQWLQQCQPDNQHSGRVCSQPCGRCDQHASASAWLGRQFIS